MSDHLSVYLTAPSFEVAQTIGRTLVEERLAACVNIVPGMHSIYRWQSKIETAVEVVLIAKSRSALFEAIEKRVRELHPYDCPCIVAWPIGAGYQPILTELKRRRLGRPHNCSANYPSPKLRF